MTCKCDPKKFYFTTANESNKVQNRYLTEGACPNRCGPLTREGEYKAFCGCCNFEWQSVRIPVIWPARLESLGS